MLRHLFLIIAIVFLSAISKAQRSNTDTLQLQQTVTNFFNALSALDSAKAKSFCANDLVILETGKLWNFDSIAVRIRMRKLMPDFKRINTLGFIQSVIYGNTGWVCYYNKAEMSSGGQTKIVNWLESAVLTKQNNMWKINLLHSTSLDATK